MYKFFASLAAASFISLSASAQSVDTVESAFGPVAFSSKQWEVRKQKNRMTDEIDCTAVLKESPNVQSGKDKLFIQANSNGLLNSYEIRFDDRPVERLQLPLDFEKKRSVAVIKDDLFEKALSATRVRIEFNYYSTSSSFRDLNIDGLLDVVNYLKNNC